MTVRPQGSRSGFTLAAATIRASSLAAPAIDASVPAGGYNVEVQLAFTTADELFSLLEQCGEALDYRDVWPRIFPVSNCAPELMHQLVNDIVHNDDRFSWESSVHIGLTRWRAERRDLADVAFTVVDLETTGGTPGFAKITEIGAVRLEGGRAVATFSELVDPGVPIPAIITQITGIDDETVAAAPPIDEVLPRFVGFAADSVLVAHNARFDLSFLDYELGILMRCTFPRPALCTLRLARRLAPGTRCNLGALAQRFDTAVKPEHRALQDAQATAELLLIFLSQLEEQGMTTLEEVARFCEPGARRNYHKITLTESVPTTSGVYTMRDARGQALYIGKAENLRRRTRDHFLQRQAYGARQALELLDHIDIVETGSEFAALMLEQRLIARHRPLYNQHGARVPSYHYVKLTADEYPRLYATPNLRLDGSLYAGPFRKASFARGFVDTLNAIYPLRTCVHLRPGRTCPRVDIGACLAPCREQISGGYAQVVEQVRRVLEGRGDELDEQLQARQGDMVKALAFEQAAKLQEQRETLAKAMRKVGRLRDALSNYAVLAYPSLKPGKLTLFGVAAGSIVDERVVEPDSFGSGDALAFLSAVYAATPPAPPLPPGALDEILLVHGWLERHRAAVNVLPLAAPAGAAVVAAGEGATGAGADAPTDAAELAAAADTLLARIALCSAQ
jgi:DNA polymerase-3 subunit epsilon